MSTEEKIDIELFKLVFRAIAQSDNLEIMANHLTQLLVAALEIKGCTIFALNPELDELEVLASFGMSMAYLQKGPILSDKSIADTFRGKGGATGRDVAGQQCHGDQEERNGNERCRVSGRDAIKQARQEPRQRQRSHNADGHPDQRQPEALADNHPENITLLGSQRHTDADLLGAVPDIKRGETVKADGRQQ